MNFKNLLFLSFLAVAGCSSTDSRVSENTAVEPDSAQSVASQNAVRPADAHDPVVLDHPSVGLELFQLTVAERQAQVGNRVTLQNAKVTRVNGDYNFWVAPTKNATPGNTVAVVLKREKLGVDAELKNRVRVGQLLTIHGVLRPASEVIDILKLKNKARTQFLNEGTYVSAERIEGASHVSE